MSAQQYIAMLCVLALPLANNALAEESELSVLRSEIDSLRADYETRIAALEGRLVAVEQAQSFSHGPQPNIVSSSSAYNPAIGVIFQGQAWNYGDNPEDNSIPGFPLGGEAGPFDEGLAIGEAEINISASVDDKFTAWLTAPLVVEDGEAAIEIEEAWLETTALPGGLSARFGRFFSGIGYLNSRHAHAWDFADQPLAYQVFLGDQYLDDGVQFRWIAPTDLYIEAGAEAFRGSRYPGAGAAHSGYGANSLFDIGEAEINISANVDDKFTAWLTAPLVVEDGEAAIEIEEAWLETTALPGGLSARFGRFFSGIGYLNSRHAHAWDFADQPLAYQVFLGDQYLDDGVQFRWIAPTDLYIEAGAEAFRGSRYPGAGAAHSGYGANSLFVNVGGDWGSDHSWLAGISHLSTTSFDRESGDKGAPLLFSGDSDTTIAHVVYKWAPKGNWKQRNLVLSTEVLRRAEDGDYTLPGGRPVSYDVGQEGWYVQAVYQPFPQWRFGTRVDHLSTDDAGPLLVGSPLVAPDDDPMRYSLMTDWSNSEFSRLRLQYTRDEAGLASDDQWGLQYILSIGAHGSHSF